MARRSAERLKSYLELITRKQGLEGALEAASTAAYDAAWQHLRAKRSTLTADQVPVLKKNLAQIILASACNGNRDADQLKEIALRGVSGLSSVSA